MKYASLMRNAGLLMALSVALFVGCKKEKDQKGPSLAVVNEPGVVTGDLTLEPNVDDSLRFKLIAQKGSGKDDADLKDYSFTYTLGGANVPVYTNRPAPNGQSFTIDTTVRVRGVSGDKREYTFTVTDKNGKSVSRTFTITFQSTSGGPTTRVDSLYNGSYTNQDGKGTYLRYDPSSNPIFALQTRSQAEGNPSKILFVYYHSSTNNQRPHSVISPAIMGTSVYSSVPSLYWPNVPTDSTYFKIPNFPSGVDFASANYQQIKDAFNNGTNISEEYTGNRTQRAECTNGRVLAFKQGNIYGLIRVESVTSGGPGATLSVKVARP
jgi:hypothetical protein